MAPTFHDVEDQAEEGGPCGRGGDVHLVVAQREGPGVGHRGSVRLQVLQGERSP